MKRNEILTKFKDIAKIAKEISKIKNVKAIYLFRSYAVRKQSPLSDIDLCILGELTENQKIKVMGFSSDNLDISFFDELPVYIRFSVLKQGQLLACNNKEFLQEKIIRTIKEYLDFLPVLNKYCYETLKCTI